MFDRRRPALRTALGKMAVTGAASLAAVFALAPVAIAADDVTPPETTEPTPQPTDTPSPTPDEPVVTTPTSPTPEAPTEKPGLGAKQLETKQADPLVADFGRQKYRVGVQIADGSYVPEGTTTVGSVIRITETGPNVVDGNGDPVDSYTFTCTTEAGTGDENSTGTYCTNPDPVSRRAAAAAAAAPVVAKGGVEVFPDESSAPFGQMFYAQPESTVTFTQVQAGDNLVKTAKVATIEPCEGTIDFGDVLQCPGNLDDGTKASLVMFSNPGLPPLASDDAETTDPGEPVDVEILANDDTVKGAPLIGLDVVSEPSDGKAKVLAPLDEPVYNYPRGEAPPIEGAAVEPAAVGDATAGRVIRYTPKAGFTGKDTFDYTITTQNGTATATVTITIRDGAAGGDGDGILPDTGGSDLMLLAYGGALLGGGGWLIFLGRRRALGPHALVD